MSTLTETSHAGEYIVSESNGHRSREAITVASGQDLVAGAVIGKVTASGYYAEWDPDAVNGSQTAVGILFDAVDATSAATAGVAHVRDCEVNGDELTFKTGSTSDDKSLAAYHLGVEHVIVRGIVPVAPES